MAVVGVTASSSPSRTATLAPAAVAIAAAVWASWPGLADTAARWADDPQYSHGYVVPLFAAYLLWDRRNRLAAADVRPRWWGLGIVALGLAAKAAGFVLFQPWLDVVSLPVILAGIAAAAGGRGALAWAAPALLFSLFMVPLPYRLQSVMGGALQRVATVASTYALQTLGVPAVAEGNVILLSETRVGVVEACSGLGMLVTFFALAAAVAIVVRRGWLERAVVVLSAVPIAVLANVARITLTGLLYESGRGEAARVFFHDLAGLLMMPFAVLVMVAELYVMRRAVVVMWPRPVPAPAPAAGPVVAKA